MKKTRIAIILTIVVALSFGVFNPQLFAAFNKFKLKDVEVVNTSDKIQIEWGDVAEEYSITLNKEPYTKTSDTSITFQNLKPNFPYDIKIEALEKNEILDTIVIQTSTDHEDTAKESFKYEIEAGLTTAIIKDTEAKVIFQNVPDDDLIYIIEKNNKEYGKLKGNTNFIIDSDLDPDTQYRYSIVGKVKLNKKEKENIKKSVNLNVDNLEKEYELARSFKTLKEDTSNKANAATISPTTPAVKFIYTTFIPMASFYFNPKVAFIPCPGCELMTVESDYKEFLGDDRNFDPHVLSGQAYRTRTYATVFFPDGKRGNLKFTPYANETHGKHYKTGKWNAKLTNMDDVFIKSKTLTTDKVTYTVYHDASNPLHDVKNPVTGGTIKAPGITYEYTNEVYKSGTYKIVGSHDKAPNHEMSFTELPGEVHKVDGKVFESSYGNLFQDKMDNKTTFFSLFKGMPNKQINEQGTWDY